MRLDCALILGSVLGVLKCSERSSAQDSLVRPFRPSQRTYPLPVLVQAAIRTLNDTLACLRNNRLLLLVKDIRTKVLCGTNSDTGTKFTTRTLATPARAAAAHALVATAVADHDR